MAVLEKITKNSKAKKKVGVFPHFLGNKNIFYPNKEFLLALKFLRWKCSALFPHLKV